MEPRELRFSYNPHGKPGLFPRSDEQALNFNISHSGEFALLAFALERKIGIDLERIRTDFPYEQIVERFFLPREDHAG
jgi:4'-phosphopantetheinyl transferase